MSGNVPNAQIVQAFSRFGLGGKTTDAIPDDPVAWLTGQLSGADPIVNTGYSLGAYLGQVAAAVSAPPHSQQQIAARTTVFATLANEQSMLLQAAITTATPFRERLVQFWANHFAVQTQGNLTVSATAGHFVRNAIRPYVNDTFANMLLAVMQHPAMLSSLNNDISIGPQSAHGIASGLGFNENLARETLELFTVGLGANFTQADVDALAYMLTGWTVSLVPTTAGFVIDANWHQPGPQTLMGTTYPGSVFDAFQALTALATHPATYQHLATKLVRHFVSDTPDPNDVTAVANALSASGGSLSAAATALIALTNAWVPQTKLRSPTDLIIAGLRATGAPLNAAKPAAASMADLGQPIWSPPFPNGWSDVGADWAAPSQMMLRTNWANTFCSAFTHVDPNAVTNAALGALISPATIAMLARVTATHDKLTILFCSPEFQRR